jgi:predicted cobalt transporter CbtA
MAAARIGPCGSGSLSKPMNQPQHNAPPAPTPKRDDFDITKVEWPPQDKWDRLYRNIVLIVLVVGIGIGFYFRA